jgi:hypothetical protein
MAALGLTGDIRADTLIVIRKGEVKAGATTDIPSSFIRGLPRGRLINSTADPTSDPRAVRPLHRISPDIPRSLARKAARARQTQMRWRRPISDPRGYVQVKALTPRDVDVFVHNEGWIKAPPEVVWANLIDATAWPSWYSNSADVHLEGGVERLAKGVRFDWRTFGFLITSRVDVLEPNREIGWSVETPDRKGLVEEIEKKSNRSLYLQIRSI